MTGRRRQRSRRVWPPYGAEDGFALVETVFAVSLFAFVMASVMGLLTSGIAGLSVARQRTLAEQAASNEIEVVRQMQYSAVGTVEGNPGGNLAPTSTLTVSGLKVTETIQVVWVNDPAPTAYRTYADYKRVTVTIRRSSDGSLLAQESTFVGPASQSQYGGLSEGIVKAQVMDMGNNTPMQGVTVGIADGPSTASSDTTDANGTVIFPALTPNPASGSQQYYDLTVTPPTGYVDLADDVSPSAASHVQLSAGQTFSTVLRVYQPATVTVNVYLTGAPYTGPGTVTLTSSRPTLTATPSGGTAQFTGVVPGVQYTANAVVNGIPISAAPQTVPSAYPTNLTSTFSVQLPQLVITVKKKVAGVCQTVSGATVTVTGGPQSVNVSQLSASNGTATFIVPAGTGNYTMKAKSGATTVTLNGQTVQPGPATTPITISLAGTCP